MFAEGNDSFANGCTAAGILSVDCCHHTAPVSLAKTPSSSDFSLPPLTGVSPCAGLNRDETSYANRRPLVGLYRRLGERQKSGPPTTGPEPHTAGAGAEVLGRRLGELCGCHDRGLNRHGRLFSPHGEGLTLKSAGCFTGLVPSSESGFSARPALRSVAAQRPVRTTGASGAVPVRDDSIPRRANTRP